MNQWDMTDEEIKRWNEAERQRTAEAEEDVKAVEIECSEWIDALVEKWKNAAAKERIYAAQCDDQNEKYWVKQTAGILEACAKELASSAKRASIGRDSRSDESRPR